MRKLEFMGLVFGIGIMFRLVFFRLPACFYPFGAFRMGEKSFVFCLYNAILISAVEGGRTCILVCHPQLLLSKIRKYFISTCRSPFVLAICRSVRIPRYQLKKEMDCLYHSAVVCSILLKYTVMYECNMNMLNVKVICNVHLGIYQC